jgi:NADH-quinone oxidoreductase subunit E
MLSQASRAEIDAHLKKYPPERKRSAILPALHIAQRQYGYITHEAVHEVAEILELTPTEVRSVAGFYSLFYKEKIGKHIIHFCNDLPCALRGADEFMLKVCKKLGIEPGGTTADGEFTLEPAMCLAACDKAPMMQIDLDYFENLTEEKVDKILASIRNGILQIDSAAVIKSEL